MTRRPPFWQREPGSTILAGLLTAALCLVGLYVLGLLAIGIAELI